MLVLRSPYSWQFGDSRRLPSGSTHRAPHTNPNPLPTKTRKGCGGSPPDLGSRLHPSSKDCVITNSEVICWHYFALQRELFENSSPLTLQTAIKRKFSTSGWARLEVRTVNFNSFSFSWTLDGDESRYVLHCAPNFSFRSLIFEYLLDCLLFKLLLSHVMSG